MYQTFSMLMVYETSFLCLFNVLRVSFKSVQFLNGRKSFEALVPGPCVIVLVVFYRFDNDDLDHARSFFVCTTLSN